MFTSYVGKAVYEQDVWQGFRPPTCVLDSPGNFIAIELKIHWCLIFNFKSLTLQSWAAVFSYYPSWGGEGNEAGA